MTAADITQHAAKAFLNDAAQALWTDTVLLPYLSQAVLELSNHYRLNEIPLELRVSVTIEVTAGDTQLAQLPTDMIEPISMKERLDDSSDDWEKVDEVDDIDPNLTTAESVEQWAWRNNQVYINPPTLDREVRLLYTGSLTAIATTGSTIDDTSSKAFLAARTAQLAINNGGNNPTKAEELTPTVEINLDILIAAEVKNNQLAGTARRIAYKGRHR